MKKIIILAVSVLFAAQAAFAEDWFERELRGLSDGTKAEIARLYNDMHQSAVKTRIKIARTGDDLAKAIENKADAAKKSAIIRDFTNEVVALGDKTRAAYAELSKKAGSFSGKFEREKAGDDDADDFYNEIFTSDGVEDVYDLFEEAGIQIPSKKQIMAQYGSRIAEVQNNFRSAYNKYRGLWMAGITSGPEFEKAKKEYSDAVNAVVTLSAEVYGAEVMKLSNAQLKDLAAERGKILNKQINKINESASYINTKTQDRLNSLKQ